MFEIGWTEILLIGLVAVVVIGPKDLPRAMRIVGQWTGKMRRMAGEFQRQFNQALKEAELDDVRKDVEAIVKGDPLAGVKDDMRKLDAGVKDDMRRIDASLTKAPSSPASVAAAATTPVEAAPTAKGEP
jgi:sec-independent protein translocase protein TatB